MPAQDDDGALMLRYARGDPHAFTRLYERHKGALFRYLLRQTRNQAATEDLFQEVWSRVIASRERYQSLAKFSTFLFSIAHNCFIDHCRRAGTAPTARADSLDDAGEALADAEHRSPERQAESAQMASRLRAALDHLPDEQREVFVLYEETGLSLEEIGELTGVGMETAKSRLRYALAKLRQSLGDAHATGTVTVLHRTGRSESRSAK
jgi:RNA polymerase sigma-70 factor (ECF subfamily)